jgi:Ni/Fe-hydrogenase subunit HybB-like protein
LLLYGMAAPAVRGIGAWGNNIPYVWGFDIANYIWWVGIANGASLFASILVLRRHNLRTATNRFAESAALATVVAAAIFPVFHLGKPWLSYWMFPYPATTGLWPQFMSALTWDFWAILTHVLVTSLFWYVGLIPDLAVIRDRARRPWLRLAYGVLALGWRGSARHWALQQRAHRLVAISVIPIIFVMQSAVAFMLATMLVPAWHDTHLPLHLCVTGFATGLAATLILAHALRAGLELHEHIDDADIRILGILVASAALASILVVAADLLLGMLDTRAAQAAMLQFIAGPRAWLYWAGAALMMLLPQLLWASRVRRSPPLAIAIGAGVLAGAWLDRVVLVADGMIRDPLRVHGTLYAPTLEEWILLVGTAALVAFWLLLFARTLPVISIYETRHDEHRAAQR